MGNKRRLVRSIDPQSVKRALASVSKRRENAARAAEIRDALAARDKSK